MLKVIQRFQALAIVCRNLPQIKAAEFTGKWSIMGFFLMHVNYRFCCNCKYWNTKYSKMNNFCETTLRNVNWNAWTIMHSLFHMEKEKRFQHNFLILASQDIYIIRVSAKKTITSHKSHCIRLKETKLMMPIVSQYFIYFLFFHLIQTDRCVESSKLRKIFVLKDFQVIKEYL